MNSGEEASLAPVQDESQTVIMTAAGTFPKPNPRDFLNPIKIEIVKFRHLGDITAKYVHHSPLNKLDEISAKVQEWIDSGSKGERFDPKPKQYCLVKWPDDWDRISKPSKLALGLFWLGENVEDPHPPVDVFLEDYETFGGKWFRAQCIKSYKTLGSLTKPDLYEMYLVDIGKTTLIEGCFVHELPKHLMIHPPMAFRLALYIPGLAHYEVELDNKWKYLLLEGLRLLVKVFWFRKGVYYAKLIEPTEDQFEKHFRDSVVQDAIQEWERVVAERKRHRLVKASATEQGSFHDALKLELVKEAHEKKQEPLKKLYAQLGKVHPDRVFKLAEPNPIPKQYRGKREVEN